MDRRPSWAWNSDEMRMASGVDHKPSSTPTEPMEPAEPASDSVPLVPGFTPINQATFSSNSGEVTAPTQEAVSSQARKRKLINSSGGKSESKKPAKKPRQSKARSGGQDVERGSQEISKAFVIRKFRVSNQSTTDRGPQGPLVIRKFPLSNQSTNDRGPQGAIKPSSIEENSSDHCSVSENRSTHAGLGQSYQSAYGAQVIHSTDTSDNHLKLATSDTVLCDSSDCAERQPAKGVLFHQECLVGAADGRSHGLNGTVTEDCPQNGNGRTENTKIQKSASDNCEPPKGPPVDSNDISDDAVEAAAFEEIYVDPAQIDRFSSRPKNDHDLDGQTTKHLGEAIRPEYQHHDSTVCNIGRDVDVVNLLTDDEFEETTNSARTYSNSQLPAQVHSARQDLFDDEDLEAELLNVELTTPERNHGESPPFTQRTPTIPRLQWMPPTLYTPPNRQQLSVSLIKTTSPATLGVRSSPLAEKSPNVQKRNIPSKQDHVVPFARFSFPAPLLTGTPVSGLSSNPSLRACFRVGEALKSASFAQSHSLDVAVELYCRVKHSYRENNGYKQVFEFGDLFHPDRPPFLHGHYAIWKGTDLWEHDSKQFLGENDEQKMARVVGRIQRGAANQGWELTVLSIWEATWEDIDMVKGIFSS